MKPSLPKLVLFVCLFSILALPVFAEERLDVGQNLPDIEYQNAFEEPSPLPTNIRKILFIADMDASKILHPYLEKQNKGYLEEKQAALISDIHKMPFLITKFVALPRMKEYPYTIRVVREPKLADPFPRTKGKITLLWIEASKVQKIQETDSIDVVASFLEEPLPTRPGQKK